MGLELDPTPDFDPKPDETIDPARRLPAPPVSIPSSSRAVAVRIAAQATDAIALITLAWLMHAGVVRSDHGLVLFVAIVAGRLRPAAGSGTAAWIPFIDHAITRMVGKG